ncbi:MAG: isochorismatase family protein [Xanthomonadales bacterium]|nr:isochorismatase family protein [Xanthomonadales bacterium]
MFQPEFKRGDALLIVDVQIDFCPGGALPVPEGDTIIPYLNECLAAAREAGVPVIASRDWHPRRHPSFEAEGGEWPVHCVQDTEGAVFHPELALPAGAIKVSKGVRFDQDQYSVFDETGLAALLRKDGVERLWVGGLAQDVCVHASVLAAREEGFDVHLLAAATRPIDAKQGEEALREMRAAGAVIEMSA